MAKIHIELDTEKGDTFRTVIDAFLDATPAGREADYVDAGRDLYDPNAYKHTQTEVRVVTETPMREEFGTADTTVEDIIKRGVARDQGPSPHVSPGAPLGPYDGDRKRGEAKPGGRRRTNAQIEEDARYFAQVEATKADAAAARDPNVKPVTFKTAEAAVAAMEAGVEAAISTGEERVNPDDAADEEAERPKPQGDPTLEDLRAAYVRYSNKFGAPAAIKDIRTILGCGVVDVPLNKIAESIAKIDAAIAAPKIDEHLAAVATPQEKVVIGEPASLSLFDDAPKPAPTATVTELMAAIMGYAAKYDGTDKPDAMVVTKEDLPKVFTELFGVGVTGLGSMPGAVGKDYSAVKPEDFGKVLAAIVAATKENRFKREVRK